MADKTKSLGELTGKDMREGLEKLKKGDLIFRIDFSKIAKHFLSEYLPIKVFDVEFKVLRDEYIKQTEASRQKTAQFIMEELGWVNDDTVPENPLEFYKYIGKKYLDLVKEPMHCLLVLYDKAIADLNGIRETLAKIDARLKEIHENNQPLEIQEMNPVLYYFKEHNEKAHSEILNFILHDIKSYALSDSFDHSLLSGLMGNIPYNYSWNPESYKPRMPNDLSNKFGNLPYPDYVELVKLYDDDKVAFTKYLTDYISNEEVLYSISNKIYGHHILSAKSEVIIEALRIYEHGSKIMFASAVPMIIEGILHELCLLTGETEHGLMQPKRGFQYKLDRLNMVLGWELDYEYYAFRFRIFRNKVAHGRLTKEDADEVADLLLLDLNHICQLVYSTKIPLNQKRFIIKELSENLLNPDYNKLIEYVLLQQIDVPAFYNLSQQQDQIDLLILSEGFWNFIEKQIERGGEIIIHGLVHTASFLNKKAPNERWKSIYKKTGLNKPNKEIVKDYLKYLRRGY